MGNKKKKKSYSDLEVSSPVSDFTKLDFTPVISVVINLRDSEKNIGEYLDNLLEQTFQDFEVIVVDDLSTDNAVQAIENYSDKFNGRIKLVELKKDLEYLGESHSEGISISRGEYVYCLNNGVVLDKTALEEMYNLSRDYNADVVYCERGLEEQGSKSDDSLPVVNEPILETDDLGERVNKLIAENYSMSSAFLLVKRDLLIENKISFPPLLESEDDIYSMEVFLCSKRFLRIPNVCFIKQNHKDTVDETDNISSDIQVMPDNLQKWIDIIACNLKDMDSFIQGMEFFKENPNQRYELLAHFLNRSISNVSEYFSEDSRFEVYNAFQEKFRKYLGDNDVLASCLCAYLVTEQKKLSSKEKITQDIQQQVSEQDAEIEQLKARLFELMPNLPDLESTAPVVSVVIPMYNAEKYIDECLSSLLVQTFQDFEVIVVDDCSTDSSCEIVEKYIPKFGGRLQLTRLEENSGGGGYVPRNVGLTLARGEYIFFVDSDDFILETAIETLYTKAKEYEADVVYFSVYYRLNTPDDFYLYRDSLAKKYLADGIEDKVSLTIDDNDKLFREFLIEALPEGNFRNPWSKFVQRDFLLQNDILFPTDIRTGGDFIWCIQVYCHAKRFLRLPTPLYFYRFYNSPLIQRESITQTKRKPSEQIFYWFSEFFKWTRILNEIKNKNEILRDNPEYCFTATKLHFGWCLNRTRSARDKLSGEEIYEILCREFANNPDDLTLSFFLGIISKRGKEISQIKQQIADQNTKFLNLTADISARIDIKLTPKTSGGDFQILSISDDKANVQKPDWLQKNGVGYQVESYAGKIEIVAKATAAGKVALNLRGLDVRNPENKSERVPHWIDYTSLVVNDKRIISNCVPAWHDKTYRYETIVTAGQKVKMQIEWFPHKDEISLGDERSKGKKESESHAELLKKLGLASSSARVDVELLPKTSGGDLQILSISDIKADIQKPDWLQKNGVGYQVESYAGKIDIIAKATAAGKVKLNLRGLDIRNPENKSERVPYWIDYASLVINDMQIISTPIPVWHNKPYRHEMDVTAGQEVKIQVEWLPHKDEISLGDEHSNDTELAKSTMLTAPEINDDRKKKSESHAELLKRLGLASSSARVDVELLPETPDGDFQILSVSDDEANIQKPNWLQKDGIGYKIESYAGEMEIVVKATSAGKFKLTLRGLDIRSPEDKSKRVPYWVDYTSLVVNDGQIISTRIPIWHNKPYRHEMDVTAGQEVKIQVAWLPHKTDV